MNMPAFQRYSPVARYAVAVSASGFSVKPAACAALGASARPRDAPERTYPNAVDGPVAAMPIVTT